VICAASSAIMSKFAVRAEAQGEGRGPGDLWEAMSRDYPNLLGAARPENPIAPWYASVCGGWVRLD